MSAVIYVGSHGVGTIRICLFLTWTNRPFKKEHTMLWTIFVILMIMWLLGLVSGYTIGGYIHILLLIAIVVVLIRIIQGRNPL
jgi:hypothetical protein